MEDYKVLYEKTPPTKLFAIVVIPSIISMVVSSLYQIIDGAIVGQVLGSAAFAAVNLAMPFAVINFAIADLIGVGSSVPIAIKLGEQDEKTASEVFSSACLLIISLGAAIGLVLFLSAEHLVRLMGADEELVVMSAQYLRVYAACSPLTTIMFAVDNYLRICGKVNYSMMLNILMSVISAVLEIIFLLVFKMGIIGASLSTSIAMIFCCILAFIPFLRGKLQLYFVKPKLDFKIVKSIVANGFPGFLNNIAGRITSIVMNTFLLRLGGTIAVSAYGVLMMVEGLILPVIYGFCDSLQPAVGYNYGAKNFKRIYALERRSFGFCGVISVLLTTITLFANEPIVRIFVNANDPALIELAVQALSIFAFAYLVHWISIGTQSYLSAIGKAGFATIISFSIALVFPIIALFALSPLGMNGFWLNMPITALLSAILSIVLLRINYKKEKRMSAT